jgi:hypothetical protein
MRRMVIRTIIGHGWIRSDLVEACTDRLEIAFLRYARVDSWTRVANVGGSDKVGASQHAAGDWRWRSLPG